MDLCGQEISTHAQRNNHGASQQYFRGSVCWLSFCTLQTRKNRQKPVDGHVKETLVNGSKRNLHWNMVMFLTQK